MPHAEPSGLLPLLTVVLLAFLVPLALNRIRRIRIPIAVGEILAGMVVGRSGFNLVQADSTLELLNFLGLISLMFVSGLEIDFEALSGRGRRNRSAGRLPDRFYHPLLLGAIFLLLTFAGAWAVSVWLEARGFVRSALLLALIISTAALSITVPVLKESGLLPTRFGQTLLAASVIGDFVPMAALTVAVSIYTGGFSLQTLLILGLLAAVLVTYRAGRLLLRSNLLEGLQDGTAQIGVRASFAGMLLFVAIAETLGAEVVLGAFLAGALMSLLSGPARQEISHKLDALGFGFLIPIFFLMVGIRFDFRVLFSDPGALLFVPVLLAATFLLRGLPPALLFLPFHGPRQALAGGVLLSAQMSVTLAAASVVFRAGAITESIHAAIVLVVIILTVAAPLLFDKLMPPQALQPPALVLVVGANPAALQVAKRLQQREQPVLVLDTDAAKAAEGRRYGLTVEVADASDPVVLERIAGERPVRAAVMMTGNDEVNLAAARRIRALDEGAEVYILVKDAARWQAARAAGLHVINPDLATIAWIEALLQSPGAAGLIQGDGSEEAALFDVVLYNPALAGRPLREIRMPPSLLIAAIHRGGHKLIPHGNTVLELGDVLTLVGPKEQEEAARRMMA